MTFNTATMKKNDETTNNYPFIENKHVTRKETDFREIGYLCLLIGPLPFVNPLLFDDIFFCKVVFLVVRCCKETEKESFNKFYR